MNISVSTNRKSKKLLLILLSLSLVFLITSCGATSEKSSDYNSYDEMGMGVAETAPEMAYEEVQDSIKPEVNLPESDPNNQRYLIKTGDLEIRTDDVQASYDFVLSTATDNQGYEMGVYQTESDGYLSVNTTLAVPAEKLDAFIEILSTNEDVKYMNVSAEDITSSYFDAETRMKNLEKSLDKYYDFLDSADTVEDMLAIQKSIDDITTEIELYKGQLNMWDSQIKYSTISVGIYQNSAVINTDRDVDFTALSWDEMKYFMSSGIIRVLSAIASVAQWGLIGILVLSPILIPLALIIFFLVRSSKKKKAKRYKDYLTQQNQENLNEQNNQNEHKE